jgi:hypothetical protein
MRSRRTHPTAPSWGAALAALVAVRLLIPLAALAGSGHDLPGLPPYDYAPLNGDSFGFYAAAREFIAAPARLHPLVLVLVAAGLAAAGWAALRLARSGRRWEALVLAVAALSLAAVPPIVEMEPSGAAVFGWSLLWSIPLVPLRAAGALDPDSAFAVGFALSLAAIAVAVVATAYAGFYATGRRAVGLGAAALLALWPLLTRPLAGPSAWENGQWNVDVGLHLYTEPLSTALVAVALALLLSPRLTELRLALAGLALGLGTAVKLSNALFAGLALVLVAVRLGPRASVPLALGGLAFAPIAAAYWPKGYPTLFDNPNSYSQHAWSLGYGLRSWTDSLLFEPRVLLVLAPLALLGALAVRDRWTLALLAAPIATNALFYSFYDVTRYHPRFLYAALPALFVLEAAGAWKLALKVRKGAVASPAARL